MKCLITVLRTSEFTDLQGQYARQDERGRCDRFREGDSFLLESNEDLGELAVNGFCRSALMTLEPIVERILDDEPVCGWTRYDNVALISCADGLRPVVFRVEGLPRL